MSLGGPDSRVAHGSVSAVVETLTASDWAAKAGGLLVPLEVTGSPAVTGRMAGRTISDIKISRLRASGHTGRHFPRTEGSDDQGLILALVTAGSVRIEQDDNVVIARRGSTVLYDASRAFSVGSPEAFGLLLTYVPQFASPLSPARTESLAARSLDDDLLDKLRHLMVNLHSHSSDATRQGLIDGLRALNRPAHRPASPPIHSAELSRRIDSFVDENLQSSRLTATDIADALRVSRRSIYNHFSLGGLTIAHVVRHRRLHRAAELLSGQDHVSVTDVVIACGFENASHFSRIFKAEFGVTPSEFRRRLMISPS